MLWDGNTPLNKADTTICCNCQEKLRPVTFRTVFLNIPKQRTHLKQITSKYPQFYAHMPIKSTTWAQRKYPGDTACSPRMQEAQVYKEEIYYEMAVTHGQIGSTITEAAVTLPSIYNPQWIGGILRPYSHAAYLYAWERLLCRWDAVMGKKNGPFTPSSPSISLSNSTCSHKWYINTNHTDKSLWNTAFRRREKAQEMKRSAENGSASEFILKFCI